MKDPTVREKFINNALDSSSDSDSDNATDTNKQKPNFQYQLPSKIAGVSALTKMKTRKAGESTNLAD